MSTFTRNFRNRIVAVVFGITFIALLAANAQGVPHYKLDGNWPKTLPPNWTMEGVTGIFADANDHIWVLNRPRDLGPTENFATLKPPTAECCVQPPAVLEFDLDGNLLRSWGGPNFVAGWPGMEHTIFVDRSGNVWLAGSRPGDTLLKFTSDGKFISEFGHRGPTVPWGGAGQADNRDNTMQQDNQQTELQLRGIAAAALDEDARELYIADGYLDKRVMVFDLDSYKFKRGWGAYGIPLSQIDNEWAAGQSGSFGSSTVRSARTPGLPPEKQFRQPVHCVHISKDNLVYVCDRGGDRIQVFTKQGKFIKEFIVANNSSSGTVGDLAFSADTKQMYLLVADEMNRVVWILNRDSGAVVGRFGHSGTGPGQFNGLHVVTMDSHGNFYTGEVSRGNRVQKFVLVK